MNRDRAIELLKIEIENMDTEAAHAHADRIICELLTSLGYEDVVKEWEAVDKWYA